MQPDLTIVVTVHNAEKFLDECLKSVCNQTYENIEIICVDGGSTDHSPDILLKYAECDSRIRIINDPNTSYGHKLNRGFIEAKGEYVGILESDDMLCENMAENLIKVAKDYHTDMAGGNIYQFFEYKGEKYGFEKQRYPDSYYNRVITNGKDELVYRHGGIYTKIYRKDFLMDNSIKLNETPGAAFQDQGFSFLTDILAQTAFYINKPVYCYRTDNLGSSIYDDKKIFENMWEMQFIEKELLERKIVKDEIWNEFWRNKYAIYIRKMQEFPKAGRNQFKEPFMMELNKDLAKGIFNRGIFDESQRNILLNFHTNIDYFERDDDTHKETRTQKYRNVVEKSFGRQIVIFGAGIRGRLICKVLESNVNTKVECYCDNDCKLYEDGVDGKQVMSVSETVNQFSDAVYIIANKLHSEEMAEQLKSYSINEKNIYIFN